MPRELVFNLEGEVSNLPIGKVDREKLYGRKVRMVTDENGDQCTMAYLSSDGRTLVPSSGFSMTYVDEAGNSVERKELQTISAEGEVMDALPSTLGVEHELYGPVPPQRVLDFLTLSVYQLGDESIGENLSAALDRGEIFEGEFRYNSSVTTNTVFLLRNEGGTFGLVCRPVDFAFTSQQTEESAEDVDEEDDDLDDDLDFSF